MVGRELPDAAPWDAFVAGAANGTVFHTRKFLDYHREGRWAWDHAWLRRSSGETAGLLPAASIPASSAPEESAPGSPIPAPSAPASSRPVADSPDDGATWWSGAGASFGGPVVPAGADAAATRDLVHRVIEEGRARGYARIRLSPPPSIYESGATRGLLRAALLDAGFETLVSDVMESVPLAGKAPAELLEGAARRGAAKAEREHVIVEPSRDYLAFHALLAKDRAGMGTKPVHSAGELEDLASRLGEDQLLLAATHRGVLVAGSWLLVAKPGVGLSFYLCQDRDNRRLRATNLVMLRALEWASARGLHELDLGTSSIRGEPNPGLSAFKEAHGGVPHRRESFVRELR